MSVAPDFLITEVVDLARSDARHAGVALRVRPGKGLPRVQVDCIQIEQVLLNLVRNGIETLQLADTRTRVLTISSRCDGARVLISVHDNGPGVPPEIGARVFEPFFTTKTGGMGIGLAISRSIAEAHGGSLRLDTTCSRGARFVLALPCETMPSGGGN